MLIIFDLDGTLIDSSEDLAISMNATRAFAGMPPLDPQLIYSYVGNGAATLVRRALGPEASEQLVEEALAFFLKFYRTHALEHTRLYDGVREAVQDLSDAGHQLAVLTNKPTKISFDIVGALGLQSRFRYVYGGDSLGEKKPSPVGIQKLMSETGIRNAETWMVGDSGVDIATARNAEVFACGVTWGFQPGTFRQFPPDAIVNTPEELLTVLGRSSLRSNS